MSVGLCPLIHQMAFLKSPFQRNCQSTLATDVIDIRRRPLCDSSHVVVSSAGTRPCRIAYYITRFTIQLYRRVFTDEHIAARISIQSGLWGAVRLVSLLPPLICRTKLDRMVPADECNRISGRLALPLMSTTADCGD